MDDLALRDDNQGGGVKDDVKMPTKQSDTTDKKMSAKKKPSSAKKKSTGKAKDKASTSSSLEEDSNWSCHKCTTSNPISKSRCSNCKSWKDGVRTNYPTSLKKNSSPSPTARTKKSSGKGSSGTEKKSSGMGAAAAKSTSGKEGDISSTIGKSSGGGKKGNSKKPSSKAAASSSAASKSATASSKTSEAIEREGEDDNWTCHKCNNINPSTRSRCTECLCWKGGTKEWKTMSTSPAKKGSETKKGSGKKKEGGSDKKGSAKKKKEATKSNGSAKKKKSTPSLSTKGSGEKKVDTLDSSTKKQQGAKIDETKKASPTTTTSRKKRKRGTIASSTADNNEASLPIAKRSKSSTKQTTTTATKQSKSSSTTSPSPRKKRTSCGTCTACKRDDCGKCIACLDKVKFGGENKRKQKCFERRCVNLVPSGGGSGKKSNSATGKGVNGKSSSSKRRGDIKNSSSANQKPTTMGAAFTQRKSSMSRRPRQFKPTEKMLASMQEDDDDIGELSSRKGNTKRKTDDTDSDDESNYDDVVCCLCKCAVDFSDKDFFLEPEEAKAKSSEGGGNGLKSDEEMEEEKKEDDTSSSLVASTAKTNGKKSETEEEEDEDDKPAFQLPYKFHNPGNALILCDGPAHANGKRFDGSTDEEYKCDRAYHQQCHFLPVLSIPRGPWRCLICRYRDEVYLKEKADRKNKNGQMKQEEEKEESVALTDAELNAIFRCMPVHSSSEGGADDIASGMKVEQSTANGNNNKPSDECTITNLEKRFEFITADLKSSTLHAELTTRSRSLIKSSLSTIRNAEHSLRTFTETSRARKALSDRIKLAERERNYGGDDDSDDGVGVELGLPQELCQCVMRIAVSKMRVREMIMGLENVIRSRPSHRGIDPSSSGVSGDGEWRDAVSDLMQWYQQSKQAEEILALAINEDQSAVAAMNATLSTLTTTTDGSKSLLHHLFPEGSLRRRRYEPRTGEATQHTKEDMNDASSVTSISLDDLRCSSCLGTDASDDNDMLLCDGMGCYRSFHMKCLVPKVTLEDMQKDGAEDEDWFCPLCTAHANLIHFAQCEYFGDDPEEEESSDVMEEWEMARDVFSEAPFEL